MSELVTTSHSVDCESACCCRCTICKGVGYWSSYRITIPAGETGFAAPGTNPPTAGSSTGLIYFQNGPRVYDVPANISAFGSAGGDGACEISYEVVHNLVFNVGGVNYTLDSVSFHWVLGTDVLEMTVIDRPIVFPTTANSVLYSSVPVSNSNTYCRTGVTVNLAVATSGSPFSIYSIDFRGIPIVLEPSPGATWSQCGQNSDGTETSVDVSRMMAVAKGTISPRVALPQVPRSTRCQHIGKRREYVAGCSGWKCGHGCTKGLPAVPGLYCQTDCKSYVPDPDYASAGVTGWLS